MSISVFLSTVSDEFRLYRDQLDADLTRHNVEVKVQEYFKGLGGDTLDKLDVYIAHCDAVVHLVGEMTGSAAGEREQEALLRKLTVRLPPLEDVLRHGVEISYTQWEAWLALYHGKLLLTAKAEPLTGSGPRRRCLPERRRVPAVRGFPFTRKLLSGRMRGIDHGSTGSLDDSLSDRLDGAWRNPAPWIEGNHRHGLALSVGPAHSICTARELWD